MKEVTANHKKITQCVYDSTCSLHLYYPAIQKTLSFGITKIKLEKHILWNTFKCQRGVYSTWRWRHLYRLYASYRQKIIKNGLCFFMAESLTLAPTVVGPAGDTNLPFQEI